MSRHRHAPRGLIAGAALLLGLALFALPRSASCQEDEARFRPVDIYVDIPAAALAAYQIELVVEEGDAQIVGVEGGEHPAFKEAPFYDPRALMSGRIILAAFSTDAALPRGRVRLLTVHVREVGPAPRYSLRLVAAAGADGEQLTPTVSIEARATEASHVKEG